MGRLLELALGAFDEDLAVGDLHLDAGGDGDGLFADSRHGSSSPYHTVHSSSPPRRCVAALAIAHDALAGAEDADAQPVEHRPEFR